MISNVKHKFYEKHINCNFIVIIFSFVEFILSQINP